VTRTKAGPAIETHSRLPEVFILTGPIHSGKTTFLQELSAEAKRRGLPVEGYLSPALGLGATRAGYDLRVISEERSYPFLRTEGEPGWRRAGGYVIVPEAMERAQRIIRAAAAKTLLIVDELGPLELEGRGVWPALEDVLNHPPRKIVLTVRDTLLDSFRRKIRTGDSAHVFSVGDRIAFSEILGA
jgi:nucleoside-triphosphatase THEP1